MMQQLMDLIEDNKTKMPDGTYKDLIEAYGKARHGAGEHTEKEWFRIHYMERDFKYERNHKWDIFEMNESIERKKVIVCFDKPEIDIGTLVQRRQRELAGESVSPETSEKKLDEMLGEGILIMDCRVEMAYEGGKISRVVERAGIEGEPDEEDGEERPPGTITFHRMVMYKWEKVDHSEL